MLSDNAKSEIQALIARYPRGRSALVPALYVAQREAGWLPPAALEDVAQLFGLKPAEVEEVASFIMMNLHPVGAYHLEVCTNVPCMLRGANSCAAQLKEHLGIDYGQQRPTTSLPSATWNVWAPAAPRRCSWQREAPTGKIRYFEQLDAPDKIEQALDLIRSGHGFDSCER